MVTSLSLIAFFFILQLYEIGLDLTFSMQQMLLRDIAEALLDTRDQMVKFARRRVTVNIT